MITASLLATITCSAIGLGATTAFAEEKSIISDGVVQFIPGTDGTKPIDPDVDPENPDTDGSVTPVDPTNPGGEPNPGTTGPFSIDFASSFNFGLNKITNQTMDYYARAQTFTGGTSERANYVQVSDNRGTKEGWTLTVTQKEQLKATTATTATTNDTLTGAEITLNDSAVNSVSTSTAPVAEATMTLVPGEPSTVMSAKVGEGAGTHLTKWGTDEETGAKSVALEIPGGSTKEKAVYSTKLIWTLSDTPGA
ncbi:hypothetical protein IGI37_001387 [Enterococcus sp. AZ194]|uniref:WxL domain-containing protein n=1 Tax=Enterococcus sp. AZ194 TaxID=2774629 RepID=UPI003F242B29